MSRGFLQSVVWFVVSAAAWGAEPTRPTVDRDGKPPVLVAKEYGTKQDPYYLCGETTALEFSPDGILLAAAQMNWNPDAEFPIGSQSPGTSICVWNVPEGKLAHTLTNLPRDRYLATGIRFTPKGDAIAVACDDWIDVLDIHNGKRLHQWRSKTNRRITVLAYSPDGKILVSGSESGCTEFWEAASGKLKEQRRERICAAAYSADGGLLVARGRFGDVYVWEMKEGQELHRFNGSAFALLPDGKRIAVATGSGIEIYHLKSGLPMASDDVLLDLRGSTITTADGRYVLTYDKGQIGVTDVATGDRALCREEWNLSAAALGHDGDILRPPELLGLRLAAAVSPDGSLLAVGDGGKTRLWDMKQGMALSALSSGRGNGRLLALSPDGRRFLAGDPDAVRILDTATRKEAVRLEGAHSRTRTARWAPENTFVFSADGRRVAGVAGRDEGIRLWDAESGKQLRTFPEPFQEPFVEAVTFHAGGKHLVGATREGRLAVWNIESGRWFDPEWQPHGGRARCVDLLPDGRTALIGLPPDWTEWPARDPATGAIRRDAGPLILRDTLTGNDLGQIHDRSRRVEDPIGFSADGRMIVTAGRGGAVAVYDARSGKGLKLFVVEGGRNLETAALSADGDLLAVRESRDIKIVRTKDGTTLCRMRSDARPQRLRFTPDGKRLLGWSASGMIVHWDFEGVLAAEKRPKQ
jgi:WD40 repeat protein